MFMKSFVGTYSFRLLNYIDLEVCLQDILWSIQQHRDSSSYMHKYVLCVNLIHVLFIGKCVLEERLQVTRNPKGNRNEMQGSFSR